MGNRVKTGFLRLNRRFADLPSRPLAAQVLKGATRPLPAIGQTPIARKDGPKKPG